MGLGIPVWFFQSSNALHNEIRVQAIIIMSDMWHITSIPFFSEELLYHGQLGDPHLKATMCACDTYYDLSHTLAASLFLSEDYSSSLSKLQTPKFDLPAGAMLLHSQLSTSYEAIPHKHSTTWSVPCMVSFQSLIFHFTYFDPQIPR